MEDFEVVWSQRAVDELNAIHAKIAEDRPQAAGRLIAAIVDRAGGVATFPWRGAKFRRRKLGQYREISYRKYRVFYRVDRRNRRVYVAAIWHGARRDPRGLA